jgi:DNA-binding NtrC family response regulator
MKQILVLDPESPQSRRVVGLLAAQGYEPIPVPDQAALQERSATASALVCSASRADDVLGAATVPVIVLDDVPEIRRAVASIRAGASDYLPGNCSQAELAESVDQILAECEADWESRLPMIGASAPMRALADSIAKAARTDSPVLITGESGTGKELVARALHAGSTRHSASMISLNCATVPAGEIEEELFGAPAHGSEGLIDAATGGTQSRLLRALESNLDIRLIAASHRDLKTLVESGQLRGDLYYRLKVISLHVPPLKDRGDDVTLLAEEILKRTMTKLGKKGLYFAEDTLADMIRYPWPGNVRELENAIQRAVILSDGGAIETPMLAIEAPRGEPADAPDGISPDQTIEDYFVSFVMAHQDNMTETELAAKLGISRKSLWERRQRLNIPRKRTKKRGRRRDVT